MKNKLSKIIAIVALSCLAASASNASLIGDSVTGVLSGGSLSLNETKVVGAGTEFALNIGNASLAADVGADFIDISYDIGSFPAIVPTTWAFSDLDWVGTPGIVTGVTLASGDANLVTGISFTDDSITIDLANYFSPPANQIETWSFSIQTSHNAPDSGASATLLLAGLLSLGAIRRKLS